MTTGLPGLQNLRAGFRRMVTDPRPMESLFPGGRPRLYTRHQLTGQWALESTQAEQAGWLGADLRLQFN